jgi:Ni,Fe-hydrogenase III large subunit
MSNKFLGDYEFIWGPVKKGVCESSYYHFLTSGEELHELDIILGYKKRNALSIAKEKGDLYDQLLVIERIAGTHAFSSSLSFCLAVENFFGLTGKMPENIQLIRMLFAELERLRNHIENLSDTAESTYIEVPSAIYAYYTEKLKQLFSQIASSRYLMGINTIGGIRLNLTPKTLEDAMKNISLIKQNIEEVIKKNMETKSHIDRLKTTGKINFKNAKNLGAKGVVAKSAGIDHDLRIHHPYLLYKDIKLQAIIYKDGDAFSRYLVRIDEIRQSFDIINWCFENLTKFNEIKNKENDDYNFINDNLNLPILLRSGFMQDNNFKTRFNGLNNGFGFIESSEGPIFCLVGGFNGKVFKKLNIKYPFISNFKVFSSSIKNSVMMDFNINETSYNFSVSACDK